MKLPNPDRAMVAPEKLTGYLLSATHAEVPMTLPPFAPEQRRLIVTETIISTVITLVVVTLAGWLVFRGTEGAFLGGRDGLGLDLLPATIMTVVMVTMVETLLTRARVARGAVPAPPWQRRDHPLLRWLPESLLLRVVVLVLLALVVFVPATIGLLAAFGPQPMPLRSILIYKILYGFILGGVATPLIVAAAIADGGRGGPGMEKPPA